MAETQTATVNPETLDVMAKMSQDELNKLMAIFSVMQRFEQEQNPQLLPKEQTASQGAEWLKQQQAVIAANPERPHSVILSAMKRRYKAKILRQKNIIPRYEAKIGIEQNKISRAESKLARIEKRIQRLQAKITRLKVGNDFFKGIKGGSYDTAINFMAASNNAGILRAQSQIGRLQAEIVGVHNTIDIQKNKISVLWDKINDRYNRSGLIMNKINKINDFENLGLPLPALSFFIADKLGMEIPDINRAIENPETVFTAQERDPENTSVLEAATVEQTAETVQQPEITNDELREQYELSAVFEGVNPDTPIADYSNELGELPPLPDESEAPPISNENTEPTTPPEPTALPALPKNDLEFMIIDKKDLAKLDGIDVSPRFSQKQPDKAAIRFDKADKPRIEAALNNTKVAAAGL
ncbi:hypothetical protein FACS1894133_2460 [Clostridia bacterium]|nr:hypothetical protein FACS1894133_2460 [Clostridia bacterium]